MTSSSPIPKTNYHACSISLPSRSHPLIPYMDEHLCGLRTSEATSSSSSMTQKLRSLENLYDCMENILLLPLSTSLGPKKKKKKNQKWDNKVADGYLLLLNVCSVAKDALLRTKESDQDLQLTLCSVVTLII